LRDEVVVDDETVNGRQTRPGLTKVISVADAIVARSPVDIGGLPAKTSLPIVGTVYPRDKAVRFGVVAMRLRFAAFVDALYNEDPAHPGEYWFRIMLRARERQPSAQKEAIIAQVRAIVADEYGKWEKQGQRKSARKNRTAVDQRQPEVTGFFVLLTDLIDSMIRDQWLTFGVAAAGIGLTMLIALRNVTLSLIALVPNAMPIFFVLGMMGWLGIKINMGAAMIAAVSMGLSIDSSIHYLISFQRARREGSSVHDALVSVHKTVGRAITFSTLALIVGFAVLCTSQFVPTIYFGSLVSLSMLGGMAGNLVVLPLLITLFVRD
jgi:predicted RND superfamily exporter protein